MQTIAAQRANQLPINVSWRWARGVCFRETAEPAERELAFAVVAELALLQDEDWLRAAEERQAAGAGYLHKEGRGQQRGIMRRLDVVPRTGGER